MSKLRPLVFVVFPQTTININLILEMHPQWFDIDKIPYQEMWPDDILWYDLLFKRQKFEAYFLFEGHDVILKNEIKKIEN